MKFNSQKSNGLDALFKSTGHQFSENGILTCESLVAELFPVIDLISMETTNFKNDNCKMNSLNERGDRTNFLSPSSAQNDTCFAHASLIWAMKYTS
jgi:hypothetical protein